MTIDAHCHLNLEPIFPDWRAWYQPCLDLGRVLTLIPGTTIETSRRAIELAHSDKTLKAAVGIHPTETGQEVSQLATLAFNPEVVAIGECGMDIRADTSQFEIDRQQQLFVSQLELAKQAQLPVIVHCRNAFDQILNIAESYPDLTYVFHCFSGTELELERCLKLNSYISLAGNITFANAKALRAVAATIPLERVLVETDAPYLNPKRGVFPNPPVAIEMTYQTVADLFGISSQALSTQVLTTLLHILKLELPADSGAIID